MENKNMSFAQTDNGTKQKVQTTTKPYAKFTLFYRRVELDPAVNVSLLERTM